MSAPLFYVDALPAGDTLVLGGPEAHHAATVARLRVGEVLLIGDGRGTVVQSRVTEVDPGRATHRSARPTATITVALGERVVEPEPAPRLVVAQGIAKGDRGELAVQAMTEVGVDAIVPWAAARSVARWTSPRPYERWVATVREAAKQARRAWVPAVEPMATTRELAGRVTFVLDEEAVTPLASVQLPAAAEITLVVGPEGGITPEERQAFETAGAQSVRLGPHVLRTSTAGPAAVAVLSARLGRW